MLLCDTYRLLEKNERILKGDQFKMHALSDDYWAPADDFAGHRVWEFSPSRCGSVDFRRLIAHEVQI